MNKVIFLIFIVLFLLSFPNPIFAQVNLPGYEHSNIRGWIGDFTWANFTLGRVVSELLPYFFVFSGIALLVYLLLGGFKLLTSAGNPEQVARGQKILTNALIGFLIVISSYWIFQIVKVVLGLT